MLEADYISILRIDFTDASQWKILEAVFEEKFLQSKVHQLMITLPIEFSACRNSDIRCKKDHVLRLYYLLTKTLSQGFKVVSSKVCSKEERQRRGEGEGEGDDKTLFEGVVVDSCYVLNFVNIEKVHTV